MNTEYTHTTDGQASRAASFLSRLLCGWGVPGGIARVVAGAVIGALAAAYAFGVAGCSTDGAAQVQGGLCDGASFVLPESVMVSPFTK